MGKQKRRIYCKFCDYFCYTPDDYVSHIEKHHDEMIPQDMTPWQFSYYLRTGKTHGSCIICKKDTIWNEKTHKYNRFCPNPKCKEEYRKIFKNRMIGKYGRTHLLNDPEQQKKMLANRKISGEYLWRDHVTKTTYTGSYEKAFLEFLDEIMNYEPSDIMAPSPHTYFYEYEGEKHFYIPDFFIPSLDLEIEIKDGGENANKHPKIQAVDKVKEKLKDEVMMKNHFNYIKITNKEHTKFLDYLNKAKEQYMDKIEKPIYMIEKEMTLEDLNKVYTESFYDLYTESMNGYHTKIIPFPNPTTDKYLIKDTDCKKYLDILKRDCIGEVIINTDNDELIGYVFVYNKDHKDAGFIFNLQVMKKYRGNGFGSVLIKDAVKKLNGIDLTVGKDNTHAVNLYKKNNFVIIGNGNNDKEYYMKLKSELSKDDEVINESSNTIKKSNSSNNIKNDHNFFRYEYNGIGIYEALRQNISSDEWKKLLKSDTFSWLPKPPSYTNGYLSYFTRKGNDKFIKKTLPLCNKYLDKNNIKLISLKKLSNIVYSDEYQVIINANGDEEINESSNIISKDISLKDLYNKYNKLKYGIPNHGTSEKDFNDYYKYQSPSELFKNNKGVCWDYSSAISDDLNARGIDTYVYYYELNNENSHTVTISKIQNMYICISVHEGIYCSDKIEDLHYFILNNLARRRDMETNSHSAYTYTISKYKNYTNYGCSMDEYMTFANSKIFKRGKVSYNKNINTPEMYKESTDELYTENVLINKKDIYKNFEKFENGESNVLLVTGFSGSGKSTLAKQLASKYKAQHLELDVLEFYIQNLITEDELKDEEHGLYEFIKSHKSLIDKEKANGNAGISILYEHYIPYLINYCKRIKDKKFIIEGLQIYSIFDTKKPQGFYSSTPLIILGASGLSSSIRAAKRNSTADTTGKSKFIIEFKNLLEWVIKDNKYIEDLKKYTNEVK